MKVHHFAEREIGTNVAIEDEEGRWVAGPNLVAEVIDASGSSKRRIFLKVPEISIISLNLTNIQLV